MYHSSPHHPPHFIVAPSKLYQSIWHPPTSPTPDFRWKDENTYQPSMAPRSRRHQFCLNWPSVFAMLWCPLYAVVIALFCRVFETTTLFCVSSFLLYGAIQVLHNPVMREVVRQILTLPYGVWGKGSIYQNIICLQRGWVRQMLMYPKCCTMVHASERDNAYVL